jgi:hypothetical protein
MERRVDTTRHLQRLSLHPLHPLDQFLRYDSLRTAEGKLIQARLLSCAAVGSRVVAVVYRRAHLLPSLSVEGASLASPSLRLRPPPHRTGQADSRIQLTAKASSIQVMDPFGRCALWRSRRRGDSLGRGPTSCTRERIVHPAPKDRVHLRDRRPHRQVPVRLQGVPDLLHLLNHSVTYRSRRYSM